MREKYTGAGRQAAICSLLLLAACGEIAKGAVTILFFTGAVAITVEQIYKAQSAELDVKLKTLQLEGLQKDGSKTSKSVSLTDDQVKSLVKAGKVQVKQADGSTADVAVAVKK